MGGVYPLLVVFFVLTVIRRGKFGIGGSANVGVTILFIPMGSDDPANVGATIPLFC